MRNLKIVDKGKRLLKNGMPFTLRHELQLYISAHPESKMANYFRQDFIMERHHANFCHVIDGVGKMNLLGKSTCELGPGGSLSNAFYLFQMGGHAHALLDVQDFINTGRNVSKKEYQDFMLPSRYEKKRDLPPFKEGKPLSKYMKEINATYYFDGLDGYRRMPGESVDFLYSCTVLQHIRKNIFIDSVNEMYRMMKFGAISFHTVDLRDMLGGKKNHLRYSDEYWNDEAHRNMRCYTNRIQCAEMCEIFKEVGFKIKKVTRECFKKPPINKRMLDAAFKGIPDKELYTKTFSIMLEK